MPNSSGDGTATGRGGCGLDAALGGAGRGCGRGAGVPTLWPAYTGSRSNIWYWIGGPPIGTGQPVGPHPAPDRPGVAAIQNTAAAPRISPIPATFFMPRLRARPGSVPAGAGGYPRRYRGGSPVFLVPRRAWDRVFRTLRVPGS